jgi:hypothetical protein
MVGMWDIVFNHRVSFHTRHPYRSNIRVFVIAMLVVGGH